MIAAVAVLAVLPLKGIVFWADEAEDRPALRDAISLEFAYMRPDEVAKAQDEYDWSAVEDVLEGAKGRAHQAILRFRYVYPGEKGADGVRGATAVPRFIKSAKGYKETFAANPNGDGPTWYADWSCAALEDFTLAFFREFAARYDKDPRLAFLEVGFGHWAEYHTCGTKTVPGKNFPTKEFQALFMREIDRLFSATPVLVSIDAHNKSFSPLASDASLRELSFGLFDDSFMHAEHDISQGDGHNERCWLAFGEDRWRRAPCGGEISYYSRRDQREFLNPAGLYGVTWREAAAKYHMTFVIANDSLKGKFATSARLAEAARECGWNFAVVSDETSGGTRRLTVRNDGVAPAYHDLRVRAGGKTSEASLKGLLPGQARAFELPACEGAAAIVSEKFLPGVSVPLVTQKGKRR